MKITMEMGNLSELVKESVEANIRTIIKEQVDATVGKKVNSMAKEVIEEIVGMRLQEFVKEYIETAKITVGGGFYSDKPVQEFTIAEYTKKELAERMEGGTIKRKNRRGDMEKVSFADFVKSEYDMDDLISKALTNFMAETKKEINEKIDSTFTEVTKSMLSETVYNVLLKNDTFAKMSSNIKCIADKGNE